MLTILALVILLVGYSHGQSDTFSAPNPLYDGPGQIVGGQNANIENYPYQISLMYDQSHICGGSILSRYYVITAAHCTNDFRNTMYRLSIRIGSSFQGSGGEIFSLYQITQHPYFSIRTLDYDVSIIKLSKAITYGPNKKPISLATVVPRAGSMVTVTGWGRLVEGGSTSYQLQSVQLPIVDRSTCNYRYNGLVTNRMICAGYINGEKGACQGDSGGPMVLNQRLVGIVSWGVGCARARYPGVYASVPDLYSFIVRNVVFD